MLGIGKLAGYQKDGRGWLLEHRIRIPQDIGHFINYYRQITLPGDNAGPELDRYLAAPVVSEAEKEKWRSFLSDKIGSSRHPVIGVAPFAAYGNAKEWPGYPILIRKILKEIPDSAVLVFGGPGDRTKSRQLIPDECCQGRFIDLAGKLTLRESLTVITLCDGFVANDSGMMHAAAVSGIPLVAIYGPTPTNTIPLNKRAVILHKPVLCAPCKYRQCPLEHQCMTSITVDDVFRGLEGVLKK
jgi:heptosyltransferase-2